MTEGGGDTRSISIALAAYIGLFSVQLVAYVVTDLYLLLAQALEVLSDVVVSSFLLLSLWWSRRPADEAHMFGHGRAQNVGAIVAATVMILFMGFEAFRGAISRFFGTSEGGEVPETGLAVSVLVGSMVVLAIPLVAVLRVKEKGASVKAQRIQILKDEVAYVPALLGALFVGWGYSIADPIAGTIIAAVILLSGAYLFKDNVEYLVGKSPGRDFLTRAEAAARSVEGVLGVHDMRAEFVGPRVVAASFHLEVARGTPIEEANRISREVDKRVAEATGCGYCVIHVDPFTGRDEAT